MTRSRDLIEAKISGGDEIQEKLERLPARIAKAIIRTAVRAGGQVFRDQMKLKAPQGWHVFRSTKYKGQRFKGRSREFGILSRAIAMKLSIRGDELVGSASVGPDKKAFWGLFQEFGAKKNNQPARPFIRATFEAVKDKALDAFIVTAKEELRKNGMLIE